MCEAGTRGRRRLWLPVGLSLLLGSCGGHTAENSSASSAHANAADQNDATASDTMHGTPAHDAGPPLFGAHRDDAGGVRGATAIDAASGVGSSVSVSSDDAAIGGPASVDAATPEGTPALFYLDALGGRVLSAGPDGKNAHAVVQSQRATPDGVAVDVQGGRVYWTNMGVPQGDDGTILSAKLDGTDLTTIVPSGGTFTPKQLTIDAAHGQLYWSDREGMRVMRCNLDGSKLEALVTIAEGDSARSVDANWAVGIGLDLAGGYVYWTQKGADNAGQGSLRRAPIALSSGEASNERTDIEVLFQGLPEPIDLALDLTERKVYWTDRGDNTVSRAPLDLPAGATAMTRSDREILVRGLNEAIGISLDLRHGALYYTDLGGTVGSAKLDGSSAKTLLTGQGSLTGITYVELPK